MIKYTKIISLMIEKEDLKKLDKKAKKARQTRSDFIRYLIKVKINE